MDFEVKEVLKESTMKTGRREYNVKLFGFTDCHNSWVNSLLERFQASKSSVTTDGEWSTKEGTQAGRGSRKQWL